MSTIWERDAEPDDELARRRVPDWPDFSKDHEAWKRAKAEMPKATLNEICARAQQIKETL